MPDDGNDALGRPADSTDAQGTSGGPGRVLVALYAVFALAALVSLALPELRGRALADR